MTYQPHDPRPDRRVVERARDGISTVALAMVFVACTLVVGIVLYAVNRGDQTAATTSSPAVTTGQSQPAPDPKAESKAEPKDEPKAEPKADPKSEPKAQ
jgi:hypothetical protein